MASEGLVLQPTNELRFVMRPVRIGTDPLLTRNQRILQQKWYAERRAFGDFLSESEWRDVPLVEE